MDLILVALFGFRSILSSKSSELKFELEFTVLRRILQVLSQRP